MAAEYHEEEKKDDLDADSEVSETPGAPRIYRGVDDSIGFVMAMMAELTGESVDPRRFEWMRGLTVEQVDLYLKLHEQEGLSHDEALKEIRKKPDPP